MLVTCPHCGRDGTVADAAIDKPVRCQSCRQSFKTNSAHVTVAIEPPPPVRELVSEDAPLAVERIVALPATGFRCPYCQTTSLPRVEKKTSQGGVVLGILLALGICTFPFCWMPFVWMKEEFRRCIQCGMRLG